MSNSIVLHGNAYEVQPIKVAQAIRLTVLIKSYLAKGSEVLRAFATTAGSSSYNRLSFTLAMFNEQVDDTQFEADLLKVINLLTGVPLEEIAEAEFEELVDALPTIIEASRLPALIRKLYGSIPASVLESTQSIMSNAAADSEVPPQPDEPEGQPQEAEPAVV